MSAAELPLQREVRLLYLDHHHWLQTWLRGRLGDAATAADLAHDTFVRLMAGRQGREHGSLGAQPRALLTHIAKGLVVDHWRRQQVRAACLEALAALPEAQVPSLESQAIVVETLLQIDRLLDGLPPLTRQVFLLAQLDGLTLQQISDRQQMPVITVRRHIQRALVACMSAW
ncbi:sigma-70 family RNA polymerase sigma factor [Aquabacterium sp. OR-4]|uniref:sigma-70 family RNA polymerase sigma factor n=1 Tax=Aquabacterium sp. OR-4 TaxID=2978127 RepID=UPI0021B2E40F|nr:sigma-70 family RNA polymerase sigma factor [Aquabacterium sp. OR-4]MDT7833992.1 sigma-70 family RNA polymerase sigma factor [Aquabacterium sp. OR-4]